MLSRVISIVQSRSCQNNSDKIIFLHQIGIPKRRVLSLPKRVCFPNALYIKGCRRIRPHVFLDCIHQLHGKSIFRVKFSRDENASVASTLQISPCFVAPEISSMIENKGGSLRQGRPVFDFVTHCSVPSQNGIFHARLAGNFSTTPRLPY